MTSFTYRDWFLILLEKTYFCHLPTIQLFWINFKSTFSCQRISESTASILSMWRTPAAVFTQSSTWPITRASGSPWSRFCVVNVRLTQTLMWLQWRSEVISNYSIIDCTNVTKDILFLFSLKNQYGCINIFQAIVFFKFWFLTVAFNFSIDFIYIYEIINYILYCSSLESSSKKINMSD